MSRERIKNRILKRASQMWGYNKLESENSFDPVLELLLTACASELEKLGFEQENSRNRITERILEVLFPDQITGAIPAQTILELRPVENNVKISLYDTFKATKYKQNLYDPTQSISKELHFSPTVEATLTTACIKYIAFGNRLIERESTFFEDVIAKSQINIPSGEYWLGIHCPFPDYLENLSFHIDINNSYQKELFFYYLKQVQIFSNAGMHILSEGYNVEINSINYDHIVTKNYRGLEGIYNEINQHYWDNFFTLKDRITPEDSLGKEFVSTYFPNLNVDIQSGIIWLKFKFYEVINTDIFENIKFALNCVPVINVRNTQETKRIKGRLNIFPILGDDHFLDIDYVSDDYGHRLDTKTYNQNDTISVVLRRAGIARFDERNALEQIQQVLRSIKDETAAFSILGNDIIGDELRQIAQNLASIHQIIREKNLKLNTNPFLIVSGNEKELDMSCTVSYWHTSGEEGNHLKTGTVLEKGANNKIAIQNAIAVRPSFGGRDSVSTQDKILEFRNTSLTRGRIVTIADIKIFGKNHFKDTITELEVHKGTKKEVSVKGGFRRTIDVYLVKNQKSTEKITTEEWEYLKENFLIKLEKASANVYPYRLFEKYS